MYYTDYVRDDIKVIFNTYSNSQILPGSMNNKYNHEDSKPYSNKA